MVDKLTTGSFRSIMKGFTAALVVETPNVEFWRDYMTTVSIIICLTGAQRDGSWDLHLYGSWDLHLYGSWDLHLYGSWDLHLYGAWDLHLYAFKRMLQFLFRYDHVNYVKWGTVYLAEMSVLRQKSSISSRRATAW